LEAKKERDFQLAVWCAMNTSETLGVAMIDNPVWAWSPGGGIKLDPGAYELSTLAARLLQTQEDCSPLPVDPWALSMKAPFHQLWRDATPLADQERVSLLEELQLLLQALTAARDRIPECFAWIRSRTKVIIPLRKLNGQHSSSSSASGLPGAVFLTLHNQIQALEALVHESAHQHLFIAEAAGPLVDPSHTTLYVSPLRDDPRPLRGVLLACHALAYMAAFYSEALNASIAPARILETHLRETRQKFDAAQSILLANRENFTMDGQDLVGHTVEVGRYSA
jgi:HEXXH motif-containing protein